MASIAAPPSRPTPFPRRSSAEGRAEAPTTTETTAIVDELKRWIERTYARVEVAVFPPKEGRVGDEMGFVVLPPAAGTTQVRFNFLLGPDDEAEDAWIAAITRRLACRAAVVVLQSTAMYGYLAIYQEGARVRVIEGLLEEGCTRNEGTPFAFEDRFFTADDDEEPDEERFLTDLAQVEAYCKAAGLDIAAASGTGPETAVHGVR